MKEISSLPPVEVVDTMPRNVLPAFVGQLAALLARASSRLASVGDGQDDDLEAFTAKEVAERLRCSVDLVRERGEEWNIARVLARDTTGRATRVAYPRALLQRFLSNGSKPPTDGRSAA